jgi:hypothetical protein
LIAAHFLDFLELLPASYGVILLAQLSRIMIAIRRMARILVFIISRLSVKIDANIQPWSRSKRLIRAFLVVFLCGSRKISEERK